MTVRMSAVHIATGKIATAATAIVLAIVMQSTAALANTPSLAEAQTNAGVTDDHDQSLRLNTIGYRLAQVNADRCDHPEMMTGMMLSSIGDSGRADRTAVTEESTLNYGFDVLHIVPDSVAQRAGIAKGDEIISVNDADLAGFVHDLIHAGASYALMEKFNGLLEAALRLGPVQLGIRRGSALITIELVGEEGCSAKFAVLHRGELNAWADGNFVAVTDRMMNFATDDQELAFVVAHEMSHNILHHYERLKGVNSLFLEFGFGGRRVKATEIEADALAIDLMARANFDLSAPERILRRTSKAGRMDLAITHPGTSRRIDIVNVAIAKNGRSQQQANAQALAVKSIAPSWLAGCLDTAGHFTCRSGTAQNIRIEYQFPIGT